MPGIHSPQDYNQRLLKPLKGQRIPSRWLFLDTETKETTRAGVKAHFFYIGWVCLWTIKKGQKRGRKQWQYYDSAVAFNHYLEGQVTGHRGTIITGHNIFFDLQASGFYKHFTDAAWCLDFYYDRGLTYILKCVKGKDSFTVVSTTNWFDQSLEILGRALGLPKGKVDFSSVTDFELKKYCRRDVEILVKAMGKYLDFIKTHGLGRFSLTKASQAFTAYRTRFMKHKILIHECEDIHSLERTAYMGGRCECFRIGQIKGGPFVSLDVNAMYPHVMKKFTYPWKLIGYFENLDQARAADMLKSHSVIAAIQVKTPEPAYAVKYKGKTIFPVGHFTCYVCSRGLEYAIRNSHLVKIVRASVYRRADLFTGYVNYFHKLRRRYKRDGNNIMLLLCKYMHNSLYGKFAQLNMTTEIDFDYTGNEYLREEVFNMVTGHTVVITRFMNRYLIQYPEGEGEYSNVAIAAHITENARFELWDLIKTAGIKNVLYCDTDSIKIRSRDVSKVKHLIDPDRLGFLKIEDRSNELYIQGPKNYRTENIRKIKGIPQKAVEAPRGVFTFTSFCGQISHMRTGQIEGARVETITRRLISPYTKGRVHKTGRVTPFRFPRDTRPF